MTHSAKISKWKFWALSIAIAFSIFTVVLVVIEKNLREKTYFPGSYYMAFGKVDSLIIIDEWTVDEDGIQIANAPFFNDNLSFIEQGYYINREGFRTREFDAPRDSDDIAILFLGDSHSWGGSANPITKSYVDVLDSMGFITYNTGIPSADPSQFWAIARKYLPKLKPQLCVLLHFECNPPVYFKREPVANVPMYYWTNAGILTAWKSAWMPGHEGEPFESAQAAYEYFLENFTMYHKNATLLEKLCRQTVITTLLYQRLTNWQEPLQNPNHPEKPITDYYIDKIDSLCNSLGIKFKVFVLPNQVHYYIKEPEYRNDYPDVLTKYKLLIPDDLTWDDYAKGEYHMNNKGHAKMAKFMLKKFEEDGYYLPHRVKLENQISLTN